jgi:hypothetical protein
MLDGQATLQEENRGPMVIEREEIDTEQKIESGRERKKEEESRCAEREQRKE